MARLVTSARYRPRHGQARVLRPVRLLACRCACMAEQTDVDPTYSIDLGPWLDPIGRFLEGAALPGGLSLMVTATEDTFSKGYSFYPARTVGLLAPMLSHGFLT